MEYLKEYEKKQLQNKRNFVKQYILDKLDSRWRAKGQMSQKAVYFSRVLKTTRINIESKKISVLEVGGGNGDFMAYTHPNIIRKVMVDIDDFYKERFENMGIEFYCKDISKTKLQEVQDSSVDLVMLNHVIEHINNILFFMNEIKRVMKKEAFVYIRVPDIKKVKEAFYDDFTHIRPFSVNGLRHMMNSFGFSEKLLVHSNNSTIKLEEFFGLNAGSLSLLGAKEIEGVYKKEN